MSRRAVVVSILAAVALLASWRWTTLGSRRKAGAAAPLTAPAASAAARFDYPAARRDGVAELRHGVRVEDPYSWLEQNSDEVQAWLEAQDHYARRQIAALDSVESI